MIKNFSYVFQNKTLTKTMYKYNYNYSKRTNKSQKIKQLSKKKDANHYSFIFNVSIVSIVISHNTNIKAGHATCKGLFLLLIIRIRICLLKGMEAEPCYC